MQLILESTLFVSKLPVPDSSTVHVTLTTCKTTTKDETFFPESQLVAPVVVVAPVPAWNVFDPPVGKTKLRIAALEVPELDTAALAPVSTVPIAIVAAKPSAPAPPPPPPEDPSLPAGPCGP